MPGVRRRWESQPTMQRLCTPEDAEDAERLQDRDPVAAIGVSDLALFISVSSASSAVKCFSSPANAETAAGGWSIIGMDPRWRVGRVGFAGEFS